MSDPGELFVPWFDISTGEPTPPPSVDEILGMPPRDFLDNRQRELAAIDSLRDEDFRDQIDDRQEQIGFNQGFYGPGNGREIPALAALLQDAEAGFSLDRVAGRAEARRENRALEDRRNAEEIRLLQFAAAENQAIAQERENAVSEADAQLNQYLEDNGIDAVNLDDYGEALLALAEIGQAPPSEVLDVHESVGRAIDIPHNLIQDDKIRLIDTGDGGRGLAVDFENFTVDDAVQFMSMEGYFAAYGDAETFPEGEAQALKTLFEQIAGQAPSGGLINNPVQREQDLRENLRVVLEGAMDQYGVNFSGTELSAITNAVYDNVSDPLDFTDGGTAEFARWAELLTGQPITFNQFNNRVLTNQQDARAEALRELNPAPVRSTTATREAPPDNRELSLQALQRLIENETDPEIIEAVRLLAQER